MASLRTLFLGVYASNAVIRLLFLPICHLALLSPFLLASAWYFGLGQAAQAYIPAEYSWLDLLPQFALSAVFLLLPTRLISGSGPVATSKNGGKRRVQLLPYWVPGVRHLWSIIFGGEKWLKGVRETSTNSIVTYRATGAKHNIIFADSLLEQVYRNWSSLEESASSRWALLRNAFGIPKAAEHQYVDLLPAIAKVLESEMFNGNQMGSLIASSLNILTEALPDFDFITFNSSIVDQMQWERVADVELTDGTSEVECELFPLINEFCCNAILPPVIGTQFTESYQLLATDLAAFNQRFWALAVGLPRLSPIQGLPAAALSQKRLLQNFVKVFKDLTNPPVRKVPDDDESVSGEETDADISTPLTKLNDLFTKHNLPMEVRAAIALHLVHGIIAEVVPLVFWTLIHVYSASSSETRDQTETPLAKIKEETKEWAQAIQPPSIHPSFPAPPEIRFASASKALSTKSFPFLRSCINESRRLYNSSMSIYKITKPITLEEKGISRPGEQEQWELEIGSYIDIGLSQSLINSAPANHISPNAFVADRFVTAAAPSSIRFPIDPSEQYKSTLLVSLVAGIIQLWEISPAPKKTFFEHMKEARDEASIGAAALSGEQKAAKEQAQAEKAKQARKSGKWTIPKATDGALVKIPKSTVRVRIRRREGLPISKTVRRIG